MNRIEISPPYTSPGFGSGVGASAAIGAGTPSIGARASAYEMPLVNVKTDGNAPPPSSPGSTVRDKLIEDYYQDTGEMPGGSRVINAPPKSISVFKNTAAIVKPTSSAPRGVWLLVAIIAYVVLK